MGGKFGRQNAMNVMEMPKEIFVWRRDKMTNYNRFNHKFELKFQRAMELLATNNLQQE